MTARGRWTTAALAGAVVTLGLTGCGPTPITAQKLQASIAPTFSSLYVQEQVAQGNPPPVEKDLHTSADCLKGTPGDTQQGAGNDWVCHVTYVVAGPGTRVVASYTVDVQTNGCYAADGDGPTSLNGSRTITGPSYRQVLNPLWLINGCFDAG